MLKSYCANTTAGSESTVYIWYLRSHQYLVSRRPDYKAFVYSLVLTPLWVIDSINPLLCLNYHASIFRHICRAIPVLLTLFDRYRPVQGITGVDLQTLLVRSDIQLYTCHIRGHSQKANIGRFGARVAWSIEDEGIVIADAAEATIVDCGEYVGANLFGGSEVEEGAIDDTDGAIGDFDVVDFDVAVTVGHVESVIQDCGVGRDIEGVEVPVDVVGKHDWCGFVQWN